MGYRRIRDELAIYHDIKVNDKTGSKYQPEVANSLLYKVQIQELY
ncbi:hypothetical protein [Paenibacillus rubinfantis]